MSAVNITNVAVLDNPAAFLNPFQFEISYECLVPLTDVPSNHLFFASQTEKEIHVGFLASSCLSTINGVSTRYTEKSSNDYQSGLAQPQTHIEWKLIYVGSAEDEKYDQLIESVLVGPVNIGNYRFVFQADPPDPTKIREEDILGVTVLLLTCSYVGQEFIRVGYYVNNDYDDEQLREEPPAKVLIDRVQRNILADKPRVTKFPINFHPESGDAVVQPSAHASPEVTNNVGDGSENDPGPEIIEKIEQSMG